MKKKLLIFCLIVISVMCLFAISISAAEEIDGIKYDLNSNGTARLSKNANQSVVIETLIIPEKVTGSDGREYTVTEVYEGSFRGNKSIKYISLPPTITFIGGGAFNGCSNLVFVDFNDNQNVINMSSWGVFRDCSSLKAVCLPDNMKTVGDQAFTNCKALTAVYLPANVEHIKGNKTANDGPAFGNSPEMYLVNEKFEVRDEKGNFYTQETFIPPHKPDIYYFPSTLKTITGPHNTSATFTMDENGMVANTGMEDCAFYNLPSINSVLVLPESYQGYDDRTVSGGNAQITEFRGDTICSGLFQKCGTKESPLTVVFLGKIDRVSMGRKGEMQYTTYVFANAANTGFDNTKIGTWYNTSDSGYSGQDEMYAVFCHANSGEGAKYKIGFVGKTGQANYPELTSELIEDATIHMVSPANNQVASQPDCITDMLVNTFCFCGKAMETNVEIKGTMLGHEFSLLNGAKECSIVYENYLANGVLNTQCARCSQLDETVVAPIITSFKGYSTKIKSDAITIGYIVDYDALAEYKRVNGSDLEFGFVFTLGAYLGDKAPIDENGNATVLDKGAVVKKAIDVYSATGFDFIVSGNWDSAVNLNGVEVQLKDIELVLCGYILDGNANYLQSTGSTKNVTEISKIAYNSIL